MKQAVSDPSLYSKNSNGELSGITENYVDGNIDAGDDKFQNYSTIINQIFKSKPRQFDNFAFFECQIFTIRPRMFALSQTNYVSALESSLACSSFASFRRTRALLTWIIHSRLEAACISNKFAQVTEEHFRKKHVADFIRVIREAKEQPEKELTYQQVKEETLHVLVYFDASFVSNEGMSQQMGYMILLCDDADRCHVFEFASKKFIRIIRSVMVGELYAFVERFDVSMPIATGLGKMLDITTLIRTFTDSRQVFDIITSRKRPSERRLAIDITVARDSYHRFEIKRIGQICCEHNLSDGLRKLKHNGTTRTLLSTGLDSSPAVEWIADQVQGEVPKNGSQMISNDE